MVAFNPSALLERLLGEPVEAEWIEFKASQGDHEIIGKSISALANGAMLADRDRAFLVFGVEDITRAKIDTAVRLKAKKVGGIPFEMWIANSLDPPITLEIIEFESERKTFCIVCIDASYERPVKFKNSEYIRVGESTTSLSRFPDRARALWLATGRRRFEDITARSNLSLENVLSLIDVNTYYRLVTEPVPSDSKEILRRFISKKFIIDNMNGSYDITCLAAILFAKDMNDFPPLMYKSVRVIQYRGDDKRHSEIEQEGKRGYALGFPGIMKFIQDRIPKEERYQDGIRHVVYAYPEVAVREIVANALIHQDFTVSGAGPVIEIYKNRIEVTNPGSSLISIDRILDDRRSRNEKLANTMRELGLCEERGGGLDKVILDVELRNLPPPDFIVTENSFRVVLPGPRSFSEMSKLERRRACFFHCVIRYLKQDFMSNASLRERFLLRDADYQVVSSVISDAIKAGRIAPSDPNQGNRNARYIPCFAAAASRD